MMVDSAKQMNHMEKVSTMDVEEQLLNKSVLTSDVESGSDSNNEEVVSDVENVEKKNTSDNRKLKMFGFMSLATIMLLAAFVVFVWATENEFGLSLIENTVGESLALSLAKRRGKKSKSKKRRRDDTSEDSDSDDEDEESTTTTTTKKSRKKKAKAAPAPAAAPMMMPTIMINNANGNSNAGNNNVSNNGGSSRESRGFSDEDEWEYDPNAPETSCVAGMFKQPACCIACFLPCINMKSSGSKAGLTDDESNSDCMIVMVLTWFKHAGILCANCLLPCYLSSWKAKVYERIRRKQPDCLTDWCCFFCCTPCHLAAVDGTIDNTKKRVRRN